MNYIAQIVNENESFKLDGGLINSLGIFTA